MKTMCPLCIYIDRIHMTTVFFKVTQCPYIHVYIYVYIYIYIYLIEIIQNVQGCDLKFHAMNDDFQAILKLSHNSNTLILDKV